MTIALQPVTLRCEYRFNPMGIDSPSPRLFWQLDADGRRDAMQSAYQIQVGVDGELWDTGKVASSRSVHIPYQGIELKSNQLVTWKVRVWDEGDVESDWSEEAFWQMGLLTSNDWRARWISLPPMRPHIDLLPVSYLRLEFEVGKPVTRAVLYATARGVYVPHMNGLRISDAHFAPGWTDYNKRIAYQTYDVTTSITEGVNCIGACLGDGWYTGYIGWDLKRNNYGQRPQFLAQICLEYADGTSELIGTDDSWRGATGPILFSDMLTGESYDARLEMPDWDTVGFDTTGWRSVNVEPEHDLQIQRVAQIDPPVRATQELPAKSVAQPMVGTFVFDLGQNMVGWARLKVSGAAGTIVQLRFGEMINPDGSLYVANLRSANATDTYIMKGGDDEVFEPQFTFHGFRYVEVTGYPGEPSWDAITGIVLHSDIPKTGTFECDNTLVNQLVSNIDWGQRGNFLSIPTDCPQRDERLGWMGDAQIFVRTAAGNRDVAAFFEKWMYDVADAQSAEGAFSNISPRIVDPADGAPAWGDAGVIVPWTIYQVYGDRRILETQFDSMCKWVNLLDHSNPNHLWLNRRSHDFGDWLPYNSNTDRDVLATAYFAYDASLLAKTARVIGRLDAAARYDELFEKIKEAFNKAYVAEDGRIKGDTQTAYLLALRFNLLPDELRSIAAKYLVNDLEARDGYLTTGFVGVSYLCPVLSEMGYNDVAYRLLLNEGIPSWLYPVVVGATTVWERWDGWTEENGFGEVGMNSFNHYSFGSIGEWLQRYVAGIDTDSDKPGYEHILLRPSPHPSLGNVRASFDSIRGRIVVDWRFEGESLLLNVIIPANTTATLVLPDRDRTTQHLGSGSYDFTVAYYAERMLAQ